ncbi:ADP-ribosylglycohydrolase family protein [Arthrobacter sp.]|uniref:ADP-ribosylglycohydrolase family protein n=1 Tax=Arthrobacter sp. TaxID=1667 RepID=UPI003A914A92
MTSPQHDLEPRPEYADRVRAILQATADGAAATRTDGGAAEGAGETETLQLFLLDGLLEAVEWANEGVAADEAACMWLAGLRWFKVATGSFPAGAPEPLPRWIDHELDSAGSLAGADPQNLVALARPEMASTGRPAFPTADGPGVLPRAAAMALLPRVDEDMTARLSTDAAALTHGSPAAHRAAGLAGRAVRAGLDLGSQAPARWAELLQETGNDDGASLSALRTALAAALEQLASGETGGEAGTEPATAVVQRLGRNADPDTAGFAAALVASAVGYQRDARLQPSATGAVIEAMHRRWVTAVLGTAP